MNIMYRHFFYFLFTLIFVSCNQSLNEKDNYSKNSKISTIHGKPNDSLTFYFPTSIQRDTLTMKTEIDTFVLNWFSSALYSAKEPILFNYYQGHDIYRFLWLRSFCRPVVFSLNKDGDKVWLTTKELNKQPEFLDINHERFYPPLILPNGEVDTIESNDKIKTKKDSVIKADRQATIVLNQTKQLTNQEWIEFETLLNNYSFWTAQPYIETTGIDGSQWIIEAHLKNKYWFVIRFSPKDNFRKAGEYLISKSGLNEPIF